jgi:elongation factor 1 alpha-like protein
VVVEADFVAADKYTPKAPAPAKPKAVSRFDQAAGAADAKTPTSTGKHMLSCGTESTACTMSNLGLEKSIATMCETLGDELAAMSRDSLFTDRSTQSQTPSCTSDYTSARTKDFFWDVPWGNVPCNRLATITMQPAPYKGGLLGGSSKLAALAAKRKQKQQEEAAAKADGAANGHTADKAVELLDRLNIRENTAPASVRDDAKPRYPRKRAETPPMPEPEAVEDEPIPEPQGIRIEFPNLRAKQPSMFGAILCGSPLGEPHDQPVEKALSSFPLPYANAKAFTDADPFSKPSPDDLVRQAQARSAGAGR